MEALLNNFIKATGWSIFHSLWQGALIYGVLLLLVLTIPKLKSKIKHNLAYGAICLMFTGFCVTFFSLFKLPAATGQLSTGDLNFGIVYADYLATLPAEINIRTEHFFPYIVTLYALGLMVQILILLTGYHKVLKLKHANRIEVPAEWTTAFIAIKNTLGLGKKIGFYLSANINVPLVIGYFKPVVLFPIALAAHLDIRQVEAILIHELSHIRRNDYLFNLIKTVMETVLFFNPFIWLSGRLISIEREHACDDLVLKLTGTPLTYAHALLKLELLKNKNTPVLSLAATGKTQHLYQRIKRITDMKTNYMTAKQQLFAVSLTLLTVIALAWINPLKSKASDKKVKNEVNSFIDAPVYENAQEIPEITSKAAAVIVQDTTRKKSKIKIVTVDAKGNQKEYNSIKEMPDSLRREVVRQTLPNPFMFEGDTLLIANANRIKFSSPEWKKQMEDIKVNAEKMRLKFNSPEWKKQMEDIKKQAQEIKLKFDSPEWKKQMEDMEEQAREIRMKFDSPEWKKQVEDIKKNAEDIRRKFNSPEWKKHIEEIKKLQDSPEYKELRKKYDEELEELKKKKGIQSDLGNLIFRVEPPIPPLPQLVSAPYAYIEM